MLVKDISCFCDGDHTIITGLDRVYFSAHSLLLKFARDDLQLSALLC